MTAPHEPPASVQVEERLDSTQVRLPTSEKNLLVFVMRTFIKSGVIPSVLGGIVLAPWIFGLIEGSALGSLYGGVNMASMILIGCLILTLTSVLVLHAMVQKICSLLETRLYPTQLTLSPHEVRLRHGLEPVKKIPSVSLRAIRRSPKDGHGLEVILQDGSVLTIGRGQPAEILDWLEVRLREHLESLRPRQGSPREVPRGLQDLCQ